MFLFKNLFSKPLSVQLTVTSHNGFHLRPVAQFASLAKSFSCQLTATFNNKSVDTKSVNTLLSLSLEKGDTFTLVAQGKKADEALEALQRLFETLMQNDKEIKQREKAVYSYEGSVIEGEIISEGIAIAPTYTYRTTEVQHQSEMDFSTALSKSIEELETLYRNKEEDENAAIYLAQKELLLSLGTDCHTLRELEEKVEEGSKNLIGTKLDAKKSDYQDILQRVKKHLGLEIQVTFPDSPFILLCEDLLPSEIDHLQQTNVTGVVLKETSIHSHTAILLRASGISSLIADTQNLSEGESVILDTHAGVIVQDPSANDLQKAKEHRGKDHVQKVRAAEKRFEPAITQKGRPIKVFANAADPNTAKTAKEEGAEGIGLLRSEFLFKDVKPSLETQQKAYKEIFELFDDITVRTLDVGGDKSLPYIEIPAEENPFLGVRGVRLFQTHPELLEEQLHAIFLAAGDKPIKIMFPMISSVEEFTQTKSFAQNVARKYQLDISHLQFGIMIEVPSVLFLLESFNDVVDFYSIGTNDLTQYLFAIERTHPLLKADELSPALFSAIETILHTATKPVSICGELAANKDAIPQLLNLGMETLSVSPKSIAQTKEEIRDV
ncbi:HPr family phosphocarrier protein [Sulfurovum sp. XGS-02]|uniref:HPr family phosphocarrier protein n=1 Tax=Sulfurovum sp. XGS-02 TaxID=2925411 RepID=UPI002063432D|nr:HPr family phosphocarrier protein [Sulfurovum sp. XGS-02]UPT77381.1 HPr family phosphocarrier protein [Sulfurovum sp. XGS-02]